MNGFTKKEYERIKKGLEAHGYSTPTKFRKGLKNIKVSPIILNVENGNLI